MCVYRELINHTESSQSERKSTAENEVRVAAINYDVN